jgi:hypothetical protein
MPMTRYIIASQIPVPTRMEVVMMIIHYRLRHNAAAYFSHRKRKLKSLWSL